MANNDHVELIKQGVVAWNNWRKEHPEVSPDFFEADLEGANLEGANLRDANLQGANLSKTILRNALLSRVNLRDTDLRDADLMGAEDLVREQIAGADVSGAKLPDILPKFKELSNVEEASKNARKLFFTILLACAYVILTILATTDVDLVTNYASSRLPIIDTMIPSVIFYYVAPFLLLSLYIYFHLYLQRLWEELAALPAVFPDGCPLDMKVYPWLLNCLVCGHFKRLSEHHPSLFYLRRSLSVFLAWGVTPITLTLLWWRYLDRHEWFGTSLHIVSLTVSLFLWVIFQRLPRITFQKRDRKLYSWKGTIMPGMLIVAILFFFSLGAIDGVYSSPLDNDATTSPSQKFLGVLEWSPRFIRNIYHSRVAHLENEDISIKHQGSKANDIEMIKGARLKGRNLKRAQASGSFLVKADLRGAHLDDAKLVKADLRNADLEKAHLVGTNLMEANLEKAVLDYADLRKSILIKTKFQRASLSEANLQGAFLDEADLQNAILDGANFKSARLNKVNFQGANLTKAILTDSDIRWANLKDIKSLTPKQITAAKNWELAFYSPIFLKKLELPENHNVNVKKEMDKLVEPKKEESS